LFVFTPSPIGLSHPLSEALHALLGNENHGGVTENELQKEPLAWLLRNTRLFQSN
jgi:hypothetical protein